MYTDVYLNLAERFNIGQLFRQIDRLPGNILMELTQN